MTDQGKIRSSYSKVPIGGLFRSISSSHMKLSELLNEMVQFSRSEKRGLTVLLFLVSLIILSRYIMDLDQGKVHYTKMVSIEENVPVSPKPIKVNLDILTNPDIALNRKLDPNTAEYDELIGAGISRFAAANILKFRKAGGRFKSPNELLKIYGIDSMVFNQFSHVIEIKEIPFNPSDNPRKKPNTINQIIEINSADSLALLGLSGIGPVLATRIIKYRNSLGGFYSLEQLQEIFGLPNSTYLDLQNQLSIDTSLVLKIPLNTVSWATLNAHPYITNTQAMAIIRYRQLMQAYTNVGEVLKNYLVSEETYWKIAPYLSLD